MGSRPELRDRAADLALAFLVLAAALMVASSAHCQDATGREPVELPGIEAMHLPACPSMDDRRMVDGGWWFARPTVECFFLRGRQLEAALPLIHMQRERLRLDDERIALRDRALELSHREAEVAEQHLEAALQRAREAEEAADAWFRHPALWFAVGVVVTVVLEVAAVAVLNEVTP